MALYTRLRWSAAAPRERAAFCAVGWQDKQSCVERPQAPFMAAGLGLSDAAFCAGYCAASGRDCAARGYHAGWTSCRGGAFSRCAAAAAVFRSFTLSF